MNAIDRPAASGQSRTSAGGLPRIYYLDPLCLPNPADPAAALAAIAQLGFDTVLVPPVFAPGPDGNRFAPASVEQVHAALGGGPVADYLRSFAAACRSARLRPMMDLPVATVAAGFDGDAGPFAPLEAADPLDPRSGSVSRIRTASDAAAVGAWWARSLPGWAASGLAGLRVLGLQQMPEALTALRRAAPDLSLVAWTPGMPRDALMRLAGADFVVSSMPWWDGEAGWFWDELAALRKVAPVLHVPEAPFGSRLAASIHDPALLPPMMRRAASMACALGDGWIMPGGFETGARRPMDPRGRIPALNDEAASLKAVVTDLNGLLAAGWPSRGVQPLSGAGSPVLALLRTDAADARFASRASLLMLNTDTARRHTVAGADLLVAIDGSFGEFARLATGPALTVGSSLVLAPGELAVFAAEAVVKPASPAPMDADAARRFADGPRVAIEAPSPAVDDGALPVKRLAGEVVTVEADIICDGHDKLSAVLRWQAPGDAAWHEAPMRPLGNDRFSGELPLATIGAYEYTVHAWRDAWATYRDEIAKKSTAGLEIGLELREGLALLRTTAGRAQGETRQELATALKDAEAGGDAERLRMFLSAELAGLMQRADDRPRAASLPTPIRIDAERAGASFAAWYEVFPRSLSDDMSRHGTFRDVERHLPRIRAMGFDVLYFPPISPIGRTNRKGPNNTLTPGENDPGSPYAIGSADGGHDALHPELGTVEDFRHLVGAAAEHELEIAIDFAIQCSPDHPWLKQHRDWFDWRPDGSIKYAENPPKKYQDIVNVDFYASGSVPDLWVALADAVMWWMDKGVRLVRVDNPHTKPLPFWQWMIAAVRRQYPDAVFLAEAFTRPKVMYRLAKVGFSQSYTYFTWRETKREMEQYLTELAEPGPRDFFRPHFFVNTPDINPVYLQNAPRSAYLIRAALAATLSGLWGVYNGFELCEGTPIPGREEYLDSEKYQQRVWDWDRPGNIVAEITALNEIRRANPALRSHLNTSFLPAGNSTVSVFSKTSPDRSNTLIVAISFDPTQPQETDWEFPFWLWGATETTVFEAADLVGDGRFTMQGKYQRVRLTPEQPYTIWRIRALS